MKTTHTPGGWCRNIKPATKYCTVWAGRNTHVAYVATQGLSENEVEANISLIAAAPDLLAALQQIVDGDNGNATYSGSQCVEIARTAIAKALGEA